MFRIIKTVKAGSGFLLLPAFLILFSCIKAPEGSLITLPGADKVQTFRLNGMHVLEYRLKVKYPASEQIAEVRDRLKRAGWKPLSYIFLFPGNSSSQVLGWTFFNDPPRRPVWVIYEWTGDWLDPDGNLVTYTFRYKDSMAKYQQSTFILKPARDDLAVTAIYTPAAVAKHKQRALNPKS